MALAMRVRSVGSCAAVRVAPVRPRIARSVVARVQAEGKTSAEAIKIAEEICREGTAAECAAAWDEAERAQAAEEFQIKRRLKMMRTASEAANAAGAAAVASLSTDPLEKFCADTPDADECRVYED